MGRCHHVATPRRLSRRKPQRLQVSLHSLAKDAKCFKRPFLGMAMNDFQTAEGLRRSIELACPERTRISKGKVRAQGHDGPATCTVKKARHLVAHSHRDQLPSLRPVEVMPSLVCVVPREEHLLLRVQVGRREHVRIAAVAVREHHHRVIEEGARHEVGIGPLAVDIGKVFAAAQAKFDKELHLADELRAGATTLELLGFDRRIAQLSER